MSKKPNRTPITAAEVAIGRRLAECRKRKMIAAAKFAREAGVHPGTLACYESGRAAVQFGFFRKVWRRFDISPRWLVTGEGCPTLAWAPVLALIPVISGATRLSDAWNNVLAPIFAAMDAATREANLAEITRFLSAAQHQEADAEAIAAVAHVIRGTKPVGELIKIRITRAA